jgi:hypothetical protein
MKPSQKNLWFVPTEIPRATLFMASVPCRHFTQVWPKIGLGDKVKTFFLILKKIFARCGIKDQNLTRRQGFLLTK